jgi:L-amino acid N-acyltransferase YncA
MLYKLHPDAERRFRRWIGQVAEDPRATLLVAEENGQVVGFISVTIERDPPIYVCEEFGLVREWWVQPQFRRRGAGRALLQHAAEELARVGVAQLRVRTAASDDGSRRMLRRCGFRAGASEMIMDMPKKPATTSKRTRKRK